MLEYRPEKWYREIAVDDFTVSQGDQLFGASFPLPWRTNSDPPDYDIVEYRGDFIVVTQSCDLEQRKVARVEVALVHPLAKWLYFNPASLNDLDSIRVGTSYRYYLLPGWPGAPVEVVREARIVELDQKFLISFAELENALHGDRLGLCSPYIEHFGQAVARFYMRVGLPQDMPPTEAKNVPEAGPTKHRLTNNDISRVDIRQVEYDIAELPSLAAPLEVVVQRIHFPKHPDTLYKARVERQGTFFGVAATSEGAMQSLARLLVKKHAELERDLLRGEDASWIRKHFGSQRS